MEEIRLYAQEESANASRRDFVKAAVMATGGAVLATAVPSALGSKRDESGSGIEKPDLTIGFIPLSDCASLVMAQELGLFKKHGLNVTLSKQGNWASIRDKLILRQIDAAHALYSMVYGMHLGVGSMAKDMAVLMGLNHNGQAITLSTRLREAGAINGPSLKKLVDENRGEYTFAHTFPTGTHAIWLNYWLAAQGIDPLEQVRGITIPPPQMASSMQAGRMDGFCAGEPWGAGACKDGRGYTVATTQSIWKNHPEKVLASTGAFAGQYPNTSRALIRAVLEASRYIDDVANRPQVAEVLARESYVNASKELILARMLGQYEDVNGRPVSDPDFMKFFNQGEVNFPYYSHGVWFLTQFRRWGLLQEHVDYVEVARQINQVALYSEVASAMGIALPQSPMKKEVFFDGTVFDPAQAEAYVNSFAIKARTENSTAVDTSTQEIT